MNRTTVINHLRSAHRAAGIMSGRNTEDTEMYDSLSLGIEACLNTMGEESGPINANAGSRQALVGKQRFGSTPPNLGISLAMQIEIEKAKKAAEAANPEPIIGGRGFKEQLEDIVHPQTVVDEDTPGVGQSALDVEQDDVIADPMAAVVADPDTTSDESAPADTSRIESQVEAGQVTETNSRDEFLKSIADSTVGAVSKRFDSPEVIAGLITKLGGTPAEGAKPGKIGNKKQQASVLRQVAIEILKK